MEKREIIYGNLLRLLKSITPEGLEFEAYYEGKHDSDSKARLLLASEDIDTEYRAIRNSKRDNTIFSNFTSLVTLLQAFEENYSDYPNGRFKEIFLLIELISKLNESIDENFNLSEDVNIDVFSFVKLYKPIYEKNFVFYDSISLENSILLLDISDIPSIHSYLENNALPVELYFHLLAKVGVEDKVLDNTKYILVKANLESKPSAIWSCLALHIVKQGLLVHEPYIYSTTPNISNQRKITSGKEYQQFNDTLIILSEYNYQKDILDKYLRIYHIIENFMYKFPLVNLERNNNGNVFSIRDFQRMFDKVNSNELNAIVKFIKEVCDKVYSTNTTSTGANIIKFNQFILNKWLNLTASNLADKTKLNSLLRLLRITRKNNNEDVDIDYDYLKLDNTPKIFATIVYSVRNSLVHNRETEFHLTHDTLIHHPEIGNTAKVLIEEFLIPIIEEIVFYLIVEENEIVWFNKPNLSLYKVS